MTGEIQGSNATSRSEAYGLGTLVAVVRCRLDGHLKRPFDKR